MGYPTRRSLLSSAAYLVAGITALTVNEHALAATGTKVRFGWQPTLNGARYFAAHDGGIFAAHGIDVEQIEFLAGPPFFAAFQSGSIDVGFMGTPPASIGIAQGVPMKIFAVENYAFASEGLVVTPKSRIKSLKDLKGKRIAAERGTSGEYALVRGLESVGMTLKDIDFVDLNVSVLLPAFSKNEIDGGWYWEPWQGEMRQAGGIQIATDEDVGAAGAIVWVARTEWLDQNPEAVQKILASLDVAQAVLTKHPNRVAAYLSHDTGVSQALARTVITKEASWPTMREEWAPDYVLSINPKSIQKRQGLIKVLGSLADFQRQVRVIDAVPDFAKAIDAGPLATYIKRHG